MCGFQIPLLFHEVVATFRALVLYRLDCLYHNVAVNHLAAIKRNQTGETVSDKKYDVFGVGNAIVDILAQVEDHVINDLSLNKGSMALMTTEQQGDILTAINDPSLTFAAGGSAANSMVAVAQSGGTAVYTGRVADDTNGEYYKKGTAKKREGNESRERKGKEVPLF